MYKDSFSEKATTFFLEYKKGIVSKRNVRVIFILTGGIYKMYNSKQYCVYHYTQKFKYL